MDPEDHRCHRYLGVCEYDFVSSFLRSPAPPYLLSHCFLLCEVVSPDAFSIVIFPDFLSRFVVGGQEGHRLYCGLVCRSDRGLLLEYAHFQVRPVPADPFAAWQKSTTLFNGLGCVVLKSAPYSTLMIEFIYSK